MSFNKGFLCVNCGPVQESKKRSIAKAQRDCCKACNGLVTPWERPLYQRAGHCGNCGHAAFTLAIVQHELVRCCKRCLEIFNTDTGKVMRKGKGEFTIAKES